MKRKKLKLKKRYKDILVTIASIILTSILLMSVISLYQLRVKQTNGQRPQAIHILGD